MTTHPNPAEKLLAMFEDGQAVDSLLAAEIRDDLALLGIDPAPAIAFAKALAAGRGTPGGRLLGAIDAVEDAEDEIARIESADIGEVRAGIPEGRTAVIAAEARRKAGAESNVVGIQDRQIEHRRSRMFRWGAPLAGIAASLLVVVVVGRSVFTPDFATAPMEFAQNAAPSPPQSAAAPAAPPMAEAEDSERMADSALAKRARRDEAAPRAVEEKPAARLSPTPEVDSNVGLLGRSREPSADDFRAPPLVTAMLIVDETQKGYLFKSTPYPEGDLGGRLAEARLLAGGRRVVALYALETPAGRMDFVQIALSPGMAQQLPPPAPIAGLLGQDAATYDFAALPRP